ncbi:hypothetical protein K2X30_04015 [bacterium]|jgi:hypothetical protein|nr:hypothetical protein [bacterium]
MKKILLPLLAVSLTFGTDAFALGQNISMYQSVRSAGMGGLLITTGKYDENFFGNPARMTIIPKWRVDVFNVMGDFTYNSPSALMKVVNGGNNMLEAMADNSGQANHGRVQTAFPALYFPNISGGKITLAFGIFLSMQGDMALRNNYNMDPDAILDLTPTLSFAHKFMKDDALSIGINTRFGYRLSTAGAYSLVDFIRGNTFSPTNNGGDGSMVDFDFGATYKLPEKWGEFNVNTAFTVNNILDGRFGYIHFQVAKLQGSPLQQPRTWGVGASLVREEWGKFENTTFALEFLNIGSFPRNQSFLRFVHLGGETHWKSLVFRGGLNQGYFTAGLGVDVKWFTFDVATYAEELSLNAGGQADRRIAFKLGFQI